MDSAVAIVSYLRVLGDYFPMILAVGVVEILELQFLEREDRLRNSRQSPVIFCHERPLSQYSLIVGVFPVYPPHFCAGTYLSL